MVHIGRQLQCDVYAGWRESACKLFTVACLKRRCEAYTAQLAAAAIDQNAEQDASIDDRGCYDGQHQYLL